MTLTPKDRQMDNEPMLHIDGELIDPKTCPKSNHGRCPKCFDELETMYGFCGYGLGVHSFCANDECVPTVYDFIKDEE